MFGFFFFSTIIVLTVDSLEEVEKNASKPPAFKSDE